MSRAGSRVLRGTAAAVALALAVAAVVMLAPKGWKTSRDAAATLPARQPPKPTLYCEFYNFMHNATVVSFLFAVEQPHAAEPGFLEMSTVQPDTTQTSFEEDERPRWSYARIEGEATITSPDSATRIVLFGLKPETGGVFWTEAGIRSDTYKNLDGKCRQAYFGGT